jgi:putative ubiquitin-RnfH superfamily antitoxin RatB of RatAB toxin-antitoxin module
VAAELLNVEVVYALPEKAHTANLMVPAGSTVAQALALLADCQPFASLDLQQLPVGIYGERVDASRVLVDGDRVELYRPLQADPREARRLRLKR